MSAMIATQANYSAVIIYNVGSNRLVPKVGSNDALIPSVFLGGDDAQVHNSVTSALLVNNSIVSVIFSVLST